THHIAAGGVHEQAPFFLQLFACGYFGAKSWYDHKVLGPQLINLVIARLAGDRDNPHPPDLVVDFGIVDDFTEQKYPAIRIGAASGVSQINRPLDPITEAEFLGELD